MAVFDLVRVSADRDPERVAILAPGRPDCSYGELTGHVAETASVLRGCGLQSADRVAIVLPNGPEMVSAFLAVSSTATCAPLNPTYREQEFDFYLQDLRAAAVIVAEGVSTPARTVAVRLGIPVLECRVHQDAPAGCFELVIPVSGGATTPVPAAAASDTALVLHTSGTTARPKQVLLSHANLCASARNIAGTLALGPSDRCLNILPLFHIHGLVAAVLSTLASGSSLVATPGFLAIQVFDWLEEFAATWYTAVPSMHQALLARARQIDVKPPVGRLRFVRSSSAALPAVVIPELEALFGAPVIEAYGMTEAAHQMACNPLPPAARKPGSVGRAAGPDVAIVDEQRRFVEAGVTGEVVIRGENVTSGYDRNPEANQAAFFDGWFRTGDQGWLDPDGYLFLTGRLKELINRGGEKIAPREVDDVLCAHPAVAQAVAFAVPDQRLGEEIGAAVVLRHGADVSSRDLLAFAADRLADFKLPRHLVFLDELPKGPTGKIQRVGLAERLGLTKRAEPDQVRPTLRNPSTDTERAVASIFSEVLKLERVHADDSFFRLGGDSLLAVMLSSRLEETTGVEVATYVLLEHDTVAALAAYIDGRQSAGPRSEPSVRDSDGASDAPLTGQQEFHWTIETLLRGAPLNHRAGAIRITGPLDVAALQSAVDDVVSRHPPLGSIVIRRGPRPRLVPAPEVPRSTRIEDLSTLGPELRQAAFENTATQFAREVFDLPNGPLIRSMVVRLSDTEHVLLVNIHHIVFDGWSMSVFISDLAAFYEARITGCNVSLLPLQSSCAEHAVRERQALDSGQLDTSLDYWRSHLKDLPAPFSPLPRGSHAERATGVGRELRRTIDADMAARVAATGQARAATPFVAYLAVFGAFCRALGAPDDLVVGAFVSRRSTPKLTRLIGCFYNILPIRLDLSGNPTFPGLVDRARRTAMAALAHQNVPYGHLLRTLRPPGGRFFDVALQLRNFPPSSVSAGAVSFEDWPVDWGFSQWDLLVELTPRGDEFDVRVAHREVPAAPGLGAHYAEAFRRAVHWAGTESGALSDFALSMTGIR